MTITYYNIDVTALDSIHRVIFVQSFRNYSYSVSNNYSRIPTAVKMQFPTVTRVRVINTRIRILRRLTNTCGTKTFSQETTNIIIRRFRKIAKSDY